MMENHVCCSYPSWDDWVSSSILLVRLSISTPSPPYMLDRGVLRQLERLEFIEDVWLDPGMFIGDGPMERCRTVWLMLRTVSKTRFGCNLNKNLTQSLFLVFDGLQCHPWRIWNYKLMKLKMLHEIILNIKCFVFKNIQIYILYSSKFDSACKYRIWDI